MLFLKSRTGKIFNEAFSFLYDEMRVPCCMPNQSDFVQYIHSSSNSGGWRARGAERLDFLGCRENTTSRCNFQVLRSAIYSGRHGFAAWFGQMLWTSIFAERLQEFLHCHCCYYGFNPVISIFNSCNSLGNVYIVYHTLQRGHTDLITGENQQPAPCYTCKTHVNILFFLLSSFFL